MSLPSAHPMRVNELKKPREDWVYLVPTAVAHPTSEIKTKYMNTPHRVTSLNAFPDWTRNEAIRELLANTMDQANISLAAHSTANADLEFTHEPERFIIHFGNIIVAEVRWGRKMCKFVREFEDQGVNKSKAVANRSSTERIDAQYIKLINYAAKLPWQSFQDRFTTKRGNKAMIGTHGEGLNGACAVLIREKCNFYADCTFNAYNANVFNLNGNVCIQLKKLPEKTNVTTGDTVTFTIVFDPTRPNFDPQELLNSVCLPAAASTAGIPTALGTLLIEPKYRGKQYNRAIYVNEDANCLFGYDFKDPNKDLLQGRDRNLHGRDRCLVECGQIISEAILASEVVRREVLGCFLYPADYNPHGAAEGVVKKYEDLQDGKYLTPQAVAALRQENEVLHPLGGKPVFCARSTVLLNEIQAATGVRLVYSHVLLHTHKEVENDFTAALVRAPLAVDKTSRIGAIEDQIVALLGVTGLKLSSMELPNALPGFWIIDNIGYITFAQSLDSAGLTVEQQINLYRTLQSSHVGMEKSVRLVDLLMTPAESPRKRRAFESPDTSLESEVDDADDNADSDDNNDDCLSVDGNFDAVSVGSLFDGETEHALLESAVAALSTTPQLTKLPLGITVDNNIRLFRGGLFAPCGLLLYCEFAPSMGVAEMEERLATCIPSQEVRNRLRVLTSLLHIVVFSSADPRAPPAFHYGPHCVCINISSCVNEQMFKLILRAEMMHITYLG